MRTLVLTLVLAVPGTSYAQAPLAAADLAPLVHVDERIVVAGRISCREALALAPNPASPSGPASCIVSGRLREVSERIVVERKDLRYVFPLDAIERIARPKDRIWNGAFIGYGVGLAPFALMELECQRTDGCWEGMAFAAGLLIGGPAGFGLGALTDWLIHRPLVVYTRSTAGRTRTSIAPVFDQTRAGVRVSVAF